VRLAVKVLVSHCSCGKKNLVRLDKHPIVSLFRLISMCRVKYLSIFTLLIVNSRLSFKITFSLALLVLLSFSCKDEKKETIAAKPRVFNGYHILLDEIIRSKNGVFRGLNLNSRSDSIKKVETDEPTETSAGHLYFEYKADSLTNYSIDYTLDNDSLEEINVQINSDDLELASYLFCDLKDYYANKLPNPTEDKGYVVYNCFQGQRKPFVVSLSDNSSPTKGIINMVIYKDK